jgi:di/tricarboxylate transporter
LTVSVHAIGILGLLAVFVAGTLRPVNLGALSLAMTFLVGTFVVGETAPEMLAGFPVQLLVLLTGVTYLFGVASANGTVERIVTGAANLVGDRPALIPWIVFGVAALPAMAGALGSAGVALLAPLSMRLAERYDIDRRMIGLMVVHGAAAGNFSPLNVLGAIVHQAVLAGGLEMSYGVLFFGNLGYNLALGAVIFLVFGGLGLRRRAGPGPEPRPHSGDRRRGLSLDQICTLLALTAVAVVALGFGFDIGLAAFTAGAALHLVFPRSSKGAEKGIAWSVALLVCGVVTYVTALQRYGTVDLVGGAIAGLGMPLLTAFLLCGVAAVTSAFASSAGILGAIVPLAIPSMAGGDIGTTGMVVALAVSATVVDATPFSTVGALAVANASDGEREWVYRGLLAWGGVMVVTAPIITWLVFILPAT